MAGCPHGYPAIGVPGGRGGFPGFWGACRGAFRVRCLGGRLFRGRLLVRCRGGSASGAGCGGGTQGGAGAGAAGRGARRAARSGHATARDPAARGRAGHLPGHGEGGVRPAGRRGVSDGAPGFGHRGRAAARRLADGAGRGWHRAGPPGWPAAPPPRPGRGDRGRPAGRPAPRRRRRAGVHARVHPVSTCGPAARTSARSRRPPGFARCAARSRRRPPWRTTTETRAAGSNCGPRSRATWGGRAGSSHRPSTS